MKPGPLPERIPDMMSAIMGKAIALVAAVLPGAAEGRHEEPAVVRGVHPFGDRVAVQVGDPARFQFRTDAAASA